MPELSEDLRIWSHSLATKLRDREATYLHLKAAMRAADGHPDELERDLKLTAGAALGEVVLALRDLPVFASLEGLSPLTDIVGAIGDLANGGQPPLLKKSGKGKGEDHNGRRFIKLQTVIMTDMLVLLGMNDAEARTIVATELTDAGASGRKGKDLGEPKAINPSTIFEWRQKLDDRQKREVQTELAAIQAGPLWPLSRKDARAFVRWRFSHPMVRSKI
jgi:hypothetical protein